MASKQEVEKAWLDYQARQAMREPVDYQRRQVRQMLGALLTRPVVELIEELKEGVAR